MEKNAEMGMGTLIIFIAMILVSAVAASVLISTTSKLQNKALDTGKLTTAEVGTGLQAIELYGEDGTGQSIDYFYFTVKLAAGSDAIRFRDILLTMSLSTTSEDYTYNDSVSCGSLSSYTSDDGYGVTYQINGSTHTSGYLNKGDVAKLCFVSPISLGESKDIKVSLVPKIGSTLTVETTTPDLMVDKRIPIFP